MDQLTKERKVDSRARTSNRVDSSFIVFILPPALNKVCLGILEIPIVKKSNVLPKMVDTATDGH